MEQEQDRLIPRWLLVAAVLVLGLLAAQSVRMGHQVLQRLEGLSTAATDNMQWNLAQAEVEHLKLAEAVGSARDLEDLARVRRQFDIFYSRMTTFRESPLYSGVRDSVAGSVLLNRIQQRLDSMTALIDGQDPDLLVSLPGIAAEMVENGNDVRQLALFGVVLQAEATEEQRLKLFTILSRLAWVVLALVVALALTALMMWRLYRRGQRLASSRSKAAARMEAMIASSLDAILVVGTDNRIQAFNGAAETIFGYAREEALGQRMEELIIPDHLREAHAKGFQRFLDTGEARVAGKGRIQLEAKRKSGEIFPVELSITVSKSGTDMVFVSFLRDISDELAAEEELRRARDDALAGERAKANLLTVMSHEMRTPLTGILGAIDLLETPEATAEQRRYLDAMRVSGELLLHHINDVLELSRLEAGAGTEDARVFDLEQLVAGVVESQQAAAQSSGNMLNLHCGLGSGTAVHGRPRAIQQVLLNLLGNALKFTADGTVTVDVLRLPGSQTVEFHVADTGQGIAPDDLDRIFDDFITLDSSYRRGTEGTGLGLGITRRIVAGLDGEISCESELGEGSLFTVSLPLPQARMPVPADEADQRPGQDVRRLLVVDDNDINRLLLEKMLSARGHLVTVAQGGLEAVEAAREGTFDLILMDVSMPGVDGIEASRRIRENHYADGVDIVALTAHAAAEDHARILKAGLAEVLTKPVSGAALVELVARRTGGPAAAGNGSGNSDIHQFLSALGMARAQEFLAGFSRDVRAFLLDAAAAAALSPELRQEAHRLAGSAAVLGLAELQDCLLAYETAEAAPPLDLLHQAWNRAEGVLSPHMAMQAG